MVLHDRVGLSWLGHATLRIATTETVVYIDPGRYGVLDGYEGNDGDIVCVTHGHHYDTDGIRTVAAADATIILFDGINTHHIDRDVDRPAELPFDVRTVGSEDDFAVGDAIIRTTAAYNEPDGPHVRENGAPYHPKGRGCGFHVTVAGVSVYCPGDTDVLDGHQYLDVDVFCPPIGGTCTMDRHQAANLAVALDPKLVIPTHYDTFEAIETDANGFAAALSERGIDVVLET